MEAAREAGIRTGRGGGSYASSVLRVPWLRRDGRGNGVEDSKSSNVP